MVTKYTYFQQEVNFYLSTGPCGIIASPLGQFGIVEATWVSSCNFIATYNSLFIYTVVLLALSFTGAVGINFLEVSKFSICYILLLLLLKEVVTSLNGRAKLRNPMWLSWYLSIILCILVSNLYGLVPYSYTFTSSFVVVAFLSIALFILVNFLGTVVHGWAILGLFLPKGIPVIMAPLLVIIEIFSYFARVASLTIRLFANMMSGHTLLKVLITLAWSASSFSMFGLIGPILFIPILSAIIILEIAIGFLQAYVFLVLTSLYFNDVINLH